MPSVLHRPYRAAFKERTQHHLNAPSCVYSENGTFCLAVGEEKSAFWLPNHLQQCLVTL